MRPLFSIHRVVTVRATTKNIVDIILQQKSVKVPWHQETCSGRWVSALDSHDGTCTGAGTGMFAIAGASICVVSLGCYQYKARSPHFCSSAPHATALTDFVLTQEAWSNQESSAAYQDAHYGIQVNSERRRELARNSGFERVRGPALFDDTRSKESEIYYRSSVWTRVGNPVAVPTDLEADGIPYTVFPDKARCAVAQVFQHSEDDSHRVVVVSLWMPHIKHAATCAPFQLILSRIVDAVESEIAAEFGSVQCLPFLFGGDWNELGYTGRLKNEVAQNGCFAIGNRHFYNLMFEKDANGELRNCEGCKDGTLHQRHRMLEGYSDDSQKPRLIGGKMMTRFPFAVSSTPTDNIVWSCTAQDAKNFTSEISCDYTEFASDHVPVKATVTTSKGIIKVVSWNIGQTDLTYFYHAQPEHVAKVKGTIMRFTPDETLPESLDLPFMADKDVLDLCAKTDENRFVTPKGTRWVPVGWPRNVDAGLAKIFGAIG